MGCMETMDETGDLQDSYERQLRQTMPVREKYRGLVQEAEIIKNEDVCREK